MGIAPLFASHVPLALACAAALAVAIVAIATLRRRRRGSAILSFDTMFGTARVFTIRRDASIASPHGASTAPTGEMAPAARRANYAADDGAFDWVRVLELDGAFQSATYLDERYCEPVFDYVRLYDRMFDAARPMRRVLMIGGGGYSYPKRLISGFPDMHVDVVEIDPMITLIAERYFFLDRLIAEYDLEETGRLEVFAEDGRDYLERTDRTYDAVLCDCFAGRKPVVRLATLEAARLVKKRLAPGGVYLANVISALEGERASFLHATMATLSLVFEHVYVVPCGRYDASDGDNNMVIATDADDAFEGARTLALDPRDKVLHDAR